MSLFITPAELVGMNEQELRALYGRLLNDLRRNPQSRFLTSDVQISLRHVEQALACLAQRPRPPQGPRF
ncbi:MAG: hypothetical protein J0M19_03300 [Sphingomonadales bacterium]|nr:hypothetical protein [Sphingomonadales bacterium]